LDYISNNIPLSPLVEELCNYKEELDVFAKGLSVSVT